MSWELKNFYESNELLSKDLLLIERKKKWSQKKLVSKEVTNYTSFTN